MVLADAVTLRHVPRSLGGRIALGVACAGWLALAAALVAELATPRWEGCGELPPSPGEKATIVGLLTSMIVLAIAATIRMSGEFTRREAVVFCLVAAASLAVFAGGVMLGIHHPRTPGCG